MEKGAAMVKPFRCGFCGAVGLVATAAVPAAQVTPAGLRERAQGSLAA